MSQGGLGALVVPALNGLAWAKVDDNRQGELQGDLANLMSLASIIAPPLMTHIVYSFSQANSAFYYPGAPFLLSAMLTLISLAVFISISRGQTGEK